MEKDIKVSVICTAYNHEKYIRQCLDGFVMQKTNFRFEVLVHDDASTDNTASIIREYAEKYPNIIKPIFQTENQYSKGVKISRTFIYPIAKGKYFAYCEGDDYWCDENKLQMQYDAMEAHPECSVCVHRVNVLSGENNAFIRVRPNTKINHSVLSPNEYYQLPAPPFQLSSYFFRKDTILGYINSAPDFFRNSGVGDVPMMLWATTQGDVYFIDNVMSNYHALTAGSWTVNQRNHPEKAMKHMERMLSLNICFNQYTEYKYDKIFQKKIHKGSRAVCRTSKFNDVQSDMADKIWEDLTVFDKIYVRLTVWTEYIKKKLKFYFPFIVNIKRKIVKIFSYQKGKDIS